MLESLLFLDGSLRRVVDKYWSLLKRLHTKWVWQFCRDPSKDAKTTLLLEKRSQRKSHNFWFQELCCWLKIMDQRDICCSTAHQQHRHIFQHSDIEGVPMEFQLKSSLAPAPEIARRWVEVHFVSLPNKKCCEISERDKHFCLPTRKTLRRVDNLSTSKEELWSYFFFEQETLFLVFFREETCPPLPSYGITL